MHGDADFPKFFTYLNLFVFSMLILVLGNNFLLTFVGWEGVGTCSYLLISFWFTDSANASAGKKAFVTNRIGDFGFMLATFLIFGAVGTLQYEAVFAATPTIAPVTATAIVLLLFLGACGKSAQLPLYVWLPDAMAGPTPVSALIHAATMVTAGVYLMTRVNPLLAQAYDWAPDIIAWVGVITALFAATIAVAQNDIKKVLAYSTISQLGYMFLAVGTGAYVAAVFHMVTHAFFKALLFLGSGSVIHGMHGEQDMRNMGGLRRWMPVTALTFAVGWLAIAGVIPLAGFWSKDEILAFAFEANVALWVVGIVTALLTAYYMSRQVFLVFYGEPRFDIEKIHPHESPWSMLSPLVVLAALSIVGGALNLPFGEDDLAFLEQWLHPVLELAGASTEAELTLSTTTQLVLAGVALVFGAGLGILLGARVYLQRKARPIEPEILAHAWYYDEAITAFAGGPGEAAFEGVTAFDATVIDGAVDGTGALVQEAGATLRRTQTGYVRNYALGIAVGAVILVGLLLTQAGL
jgi:NADH-quinone oxidoreductase subunit L